MSVSPRPARLKEGSASDGDQTQPQRESGGAEQPPPQHRLLPSWLSAPTAHDDIVHGCGGSSDVERDGRPLLASVVAQPRTERRKRKRQARLGLTHSGKRGGAVPAAADPQRRHDGAVSYECGREYEIERIIARRSKGGQSEYRIRWKGYSAAHDTWEPADNLTQHAREWFEEEMAAGLKDKRSGRVKPTAARAHLRSASGPTAQHKSADSHAIRTAEATGTSLRRGDTEDSRRAAGTVCEKEADPDRDEAGTEEPPTFAEENEPQLYVEHASHSATGSGIGDSTTASLATSACAQADASLSVGRQRRPIRPSISYSPSHNVSTARRTNRLPTVRQKHVTRAPDDSAPHSGNGSDGMGGKRVDSGTTKLNNRDSAQLALRKASKPAAAFRRRRQLHVSVRPAESDDVIDLSTPTDDDAQTTTPDHDNEYRFVAADRAEIDEDASTVEHAAAASKKTTHDVSASLDVSRVDSDGDGDGDMDDDAAEAQSTADLTYEVEAVVDRRFNFKSIAAGCCVSSVNKADGDGPKQAAPHTTGGYILLPEDSWDEGCSGNTNARHCQLAGCAVIERGTAHAAVSAHPSCSLLLYQGSSIASSGWDTSHTPSAHISSVICDEHGHSSRTGQPGVIVNHASISPL